MIIFIYCSKFLVPLPDRISILPILVYPLIFTSSHSLPRSHPSPLPRNKNCSCTLKPLTSRSLNIDATPYHLAPILTPVLRHTHQKILTSFTSTKPIDTALFIQKHLPHPVLTKTQFTTSNIKFDPLSNMAMFVKP